jgi:hypothetical protein
LYEDKKGSILDLENCKKDKKRNKDKTKVKQNKTKPKKEKKLFKPESIELQTIWQYCRL